MLWCILSPKLALYLSPDRSLRGSIGGKRNEYSTYCNIFLGHFATSYTVRCPNTQEQNDPPWELPCNGLSLSFDISVGCRCYPMLINPNYISTCRLPWVDRLHRVKNWMLRFFLYVLIGLETSMDTSKPTSCREEDGWRWYLQLLYFLYTLYLSFVHHILFCLSFNECKLRSEYLSLDGSSPSYTHVGIK